MHHAPCAAPAGQLGMAAVDPAVPRALAVLRQTIENDPGHYAHLQLPLASLEIAFVGEAPSASAGPGCGINKKESQGTWITYCCLFWAMPILGVVCLSWLFFS